MTGMRSWTVGVHSACFKTFTGLTSMAQISRALDSFTCGGCGGTLFDRPG